MKAVLKVESFSVLSENLSIRGVPTSMTCDITTSLEANQGPIGNFPSVMCKFEASSTYTLRMDFSVK